MSSLKWPLQEIERDVKFWFEAKAKTLSPRPDCLEAEELETEAEAEDKFLALRPVWLRGFNNTAFRQQMQLALMLSRITYVAVVNK